MPTEMRYAFFHDVTRTFVEVRGHQLVVLRFAGTRVVHVGTLDDVHTNDQVAMSRTGTVSYGNSYGDLVLVDVTRPSLRARTLEGRSGVIGPDGERIWTWDAESGEELVTTAARGKRDREVVWRGSTARPLVVNPRRVGPPRAAIERDALAFPSIAIGDDGKHWAAVSDDHLVLGTGKRALSVCFADASFYPPRYRVDAKRLLIADEGIAAVGFDGRIVATSKVVARSAPVRVGEALLVVRKRETELGAPSAYEVVRLAPDTLALLGPVEGVPVRHEADDAESAIVPLGGGAFAWSIGNAPPMVVGLALEPTELVTTPTSAKPGLRLPRDATPAQRQAKDLLENLVRDHRFGSALRAGAFSPWADEVCGWPDERIARLAAIGSPAWWQISAGASAATVDALATAVAAGGRGAEARFRLLCGVDTEAALRAIGRLAKGPLREIAHAANLAIERGRATRRFAPGGSSIVAGRRATPGVDYLRDVTSLLRDPSGTTCEAAPFHILAVELAHLPGRPLGTAGLQHVFLSGCEDCDEWSCDHAYRVSGKKLVRIGDVERDRCAGSTTKPAAKKKLSLIPLDEATDETCGQVGGRPSWLQSPNVPRCPDCGRLMFFVAQVSMYQVMRNLPSGTVYSFRCEHCAVIAQLLQCT